MIDGIPVPTDVLVPGALLGLTVLLVLFGYLVPKRTHEREVNDLTHDRDQWRAESRIKDQVIHEAHEQNTILLREIAPTMNSFLGALRQTADQVRAGDDQ